MNDKIWEARDLIEYAIQLIDSGEVDMARSQLTDALDSIDVAESEW